VFRPESGTLLAADAPTAQGGSLHGPRPDATGDVETAPEAVARLAEFDVERVVCHHGGPVEAGGERLREVAAGE
jgi:hypothetical protein